MKKISLIIAVFLASGSFVSAQTRIELKDAAKHIGETVTVTARVEGIRFYFRMEQRPVVFSLANPDTTRSRAIADLTLVVNNAEKATYLKTGSEWHHRIVEITGTIGLSNGLPPIEITKPGQVLVVEKGETSFSFILN